MLSQGPPLRTRTPQSDISVFQHQQQQQQQPPFHQYATRRSMSFQSPQNITDRYTSPPTHEDATNSDFPVSSSHSPEAPPKHVAFELMFTEPSHRARLPMRVAIFPHDATESIITTVKNFYGLYEGIKGVSFEDECGHTLIARYENFRNGMTVYVRAIVDQSAPLSPSGPSLDRPGSPVKADSGFYQQEPHTMLPPQPAQVLTYGEPYPPTGDMAPRKRSVSPSMGRGRSNDPDGPYPGQRKNYRSRSALKSRGSSTYDGHPELIDEATNGYSSSDGGQGSVTSSRKAKSEPLASAEISLDNIVEGGRRKRAKFESSELPLFVPPQVPLAGSSSSVSPARQGNGQNGLLSYIHPSQRPLAYGQPLQSPQSFGHSETGLGYVVGAASSYSTPSGAQHKHHLRTRANGALPTPSSTGATPAAGVPGVLPTPDPTIASCISDEDVAIQLMRLGDASNISNRTRNSTSTVDDALSGAADVASSSSPASDSEVDSDDTEQPSLPPRQSHEMRESSPIPLPGSTKRRHKHLDEILPSFDSTEPSGDEADQVKPHSSEDGYRYEHRNGNILQADYVEGVSVEKANSLIEPTQPKPIKNKANTNGSNKSRTTTNFIKSGKVTKPRTSNSAKNKSKLSTTSNVKTPISPASLPPHSRKASSASTINFQHQFGDDEEDLSSKPRCQRCRKSKKGCDRQRPCQRCKDAGIGIEGCVSEDEGNGRKGRFGRHMGVPVKKDSGETVPTGEVEPVSAAIGSIPPAAVGLDKSKKRKR
ncbi:MAG: hypothetical protein M1837_001765 [Sclerophora amabilis]|nr:MAG: hypothetical protein M1837_001765 [Sclerophora amabilis]